MVFVILCRFGAVGNRILLAGFCPLLRIFLLNQYRVLIFVIRAIVLVRVLIRVYHQCVLQHLLPLFGRKIQKTVFVHRFFKYNPEPVRLRILEQCHTGVFVFSQIQKCPGVLQASLLAEGIFIDIPEIQQRCHLYIIRILHILHVFRACRRVIPDHFRPHLFDKLADIFIIGRVVV